MLDVISILVLELRIKAPVVIGEILGMPRTESVM
jgi:hypothetical protein